MKVSITSGRAEGPTKLNTFDNALLDAGIGDVNLIKVSSIVSGGTRVVELPELEGGAMVNCVLSHVFSDQTGDYITAVIAMALGESLGCVAEHSAVNRDTEEVKKEAEEMIRYMMEVRGLDITEIIVESASHKVIKNGSVVAALIYHDD
ncbi:MAG TPA: arginine decarboxylase, pyruvoyl-dependent [Methanobacteriaceae archaeon]|nr:arginine decarboxylase, pyruvoyl-dependent [Methanobacteriaceae archaeon]